jgi:predicted RNase H-like HicB family nuclease
MVMARLCEMVNRRTLQGGAERLTKGHMARVLPMPTEIIFEVTEAVEGGYCASALGYGINTQGETVEELRQMVREAVECYFDRPEDSPKIIRLHFVRDEVLAA